MAGFGSVTASQAWAILKRHARDELLPLRLQELCRDNDRVSSLVTVHNSETQSQGDGTSEFSSGTESTTESHMLMVDLSRQRITFETVNHLLRLGRARGLPQLIRQLAWGPTEGHPGEAISSKNPLSVPSYHLSLRAPVGSTMFLQDGSNAVAPVHKDWERIQALSDQLRRGQQPGITGQMIKDVVVVGTGTPMVALRFAYSALCHDFKAMLGRKAGLPRFRPGTTPRSMRFVSSVDPIQIAKAVEDLDPSTTLVVSVALNGTSAYLAPAMDFLKAWLLQPLGNLGSSSGRKPYHVWAKHIIWIMSSETRAAHPSNLKSQCMAIFLLPSHACSEAFSSFTAAVLLPLAVVFGWNHVESFLKGGHNMDQHFVETNPRHNLPILLGLVDIWNDSCLQSPGRILAPGAQAFQDYPAFCAALESQACGRQSSTSSCYRAPAQVIDGGLFNIYDRALYQSTNISRQPTELIMPLDCQLDANLTGPLSWSKTNNTKPLEKEIQKAQDALLCSIFAHADELAFGRPQHQSSHSNSFPVAHEYRMNPAESSFEQQKASDGNRPSTLIFCSRLDAFSCGQLIAMAEHRAIVKAHIWETDPFAQEPGLSLRSMRQSTLQHELQEIISTGAEEDDDGDDDENDTDPNRLNLSTKTILNHYASLVRDNRR